MKTYKIAVIAGDGIGPEVIDAGIEVLKKAAALDSTFQFQFTYFPWGCEFYTKHGKMMDENGIDQLKEFDAIYLGAVGFPGVPDHISLWDLLLRIRKEFDQYVNIRPVRLLKGAKTSLMDVKREDINMLFIRENSEGEYSGAGEWLFKGRENEVVMQNSVFSRKGTERIIRYAFETAKNQKRSLTSISKANALNYSMVFWDQVFEEVSAEYPEVETSSYLVDAAAMLMIKDPKRFEVVVTSNLFGDILTDLGAAIAGGIGLAAGANINPERNYPSMFEPIHGSAPDIAGKGIANPLAAIWSASQMLDFFGYESYGKEVLNAIEELLTEGQVLTPDMGGTASTQEVAERIVEIMDSRIASGKLHV
ncbi:tartrate dehydrogenase [Mesobacillus campisalis]|uniref:D-malate dehydrogenase (decarboxylating) n=1 Tax=Mesobacillus campisalis TaxID=1408103 RepID=A0A0M2T146_9BACI|nr:tartrate dehydrogenase [Mesobacillus campisalis]KKK38957.1 tartrate dehydrogenase [Mesobacillus campisalis]